METKNRLKIMTSGYLGGIFPPDHIQDNEVEPMPPTGITFNNANEDEDEEDLDKAKDISGDEIQAMLPTGFSPCNGCDD